MAYKLDTPLLPASVLCTVLGFTMLQFRHKTFNKLTNTYCCLVTVSQFVLFTVSIVVKVLDTPATLVSVMVLILDTTCVMTFTYYGMKLLTTKHTVQVIIGKIDIVNERFDSLDAAVSCKKEQIICYSYVCVVTLIRGVQIYVILWITESSTCLLYTS